MVNRLFWFGVTALTAAFGFTGCWIFDIGKAERLQAAAIGAAIIGSVAVLLAGGGAMAIYCDGGSTTQNSTTEDDDDPGRHLDE